MGTEYASNERAKSITLVVVGWLWCAGATVFALGNFRAGQDVSAFAYTASAVLAAPPTWMLLARYGVRAAPLTKAIAVVGTFFAGMAFFVANIPNLMADVKAREKVSNVDEVVVKFDAPSNCDGISAEPTDIAVRESVTLRERADRRSEQVSIPFGVNRDVRPVSIEPTMPVRELCRAGTWSYVSILQLPSDIGNAKGWVPTASLRQVTTDKNGRRIYGPADFEWVNGSARYQKAILTVVNRVMVQNPKCDAFNSQSIMMNKDRAGPLIKVACFGETEQTVDFRPDDATNGRSFAPVDPIDEKTAREACWAAAKERATHPSTVDISTFGGQFQPYEDGTASYRTTFSARNSFNLQLNYTIRCSFKGGEFTAVDIQESAN